MEWELSKENVQPLRKAGRKVEILNETLQTTDQSTSASELLESQRRSLIESIDSYEGDDPLHLWLQWISWVKDTYQAGKHQFELRPVVEACTRTFQEDERYKSDIRYLRIWVLYASLYEEPQELYQLVEVHCIGQDHALFYEAYATYMEVCKNYSKSYEIYELGLRRGAQPTTRLQSMYQSFLKRMEQRNARKLQENETKKENDQPPARWTETKVPRMGKVPKHVEAQPPIRVFVDDEYEEAQPKTKAKDVSVTSRTIQQRVDSVHDQRRDQETLQKNHLLHFTRGGNPSTASPLRKELSGNAYDQDELLSGDGSSISLFGAPHLVGSEIWKDRENDPESSFEEARLLRWKMSHQHLNQNVVLSSGSTAEKAMLIEKSLNMFQSRSVRENSEKYSPLSPLSDRGPSETDRQPPTIHVRDADVLDQRMSRATSHGSFTDESMVRFMDEPAAFACTMPTSQFSVNGEETVAIKKYAEEVITLGADPNGRGNDIGGHQGLIDQTINTKECLQDILSMFNRPLSCEKPQRKPRVNNCSRPTPLSNEGFEIFVDELDDGDDIPRPQKNGTNKNSDFEIFNDEENNPNHMIKMPGKKGFDVFVDEGKDAPPSKITSLLKKKPFQVFQDEENLPPKSGKASFEIFIDEGVEVQPAKSRFTRPLRKPSSALARGSFDVFVDNDRDAHSGAPKQRENLCQGLMVFEDHDDFNPSGTTKSTFQVYLDEASES